jgi:membrane associated rhomboid family serine protease
MAGRPDLFVLCKNCSAEVSPYITECPYCGARLRKRAPKIERHKGEARPRDRRGVRARLRRPARVRTIPGFGSDAGLRPVATIALVVLSLFGFISLAFVTPSEVALRAISDDPWRYVTAAFVYGNGWYQFVSLLAIGVFGWRLELRYGPALVLALFVVCGIGGLTLAALAGTSALALGANGAALGLLAAWSVPALLERQRGEDDDADLLGALVIFCTVAAMPIATPDADPVAGFSGLLIGALVGLVLSRGTLSER